MSTLNVGKVVDSRAQVLTCELCGRALDAVAVTSARAAYAPAALAMLRGLGHMAVLSGKTWLLRCVTDQQNALRLLQGASVVDVQSQPVSPAGLSASLKGRR